MSTTGNYKSTTKTTGNIVQSSRGGEVEHTQSSQTSGDYYLEGESSNPDI
jgi:hypothetical protein